MQCSAEEWGRAFSPANCHTISTRAIVLGNFVIVVDKWQLWKFRLAGIDASVTRSDVDWQVRGPWGSVGWRELPRSSCSGEVKRANGLGYVICAAWEPFSSITTLKGTMFCSNDCTRAPVNGTARTCFCWVTKPLVRNRPHSFDKKVSFLLGVPSSISVYRWSDLWGSRWKGNCSSSRKISDQRLVTKAVVTYLITVIISAVGNSETWAVLRTAYNEQVSGSISPY